MFRLLPRSVFSSLFSSCLFFDIATRRSRGSGIRCLSKKKYIYILVQFIIRRFTSILDPIGYLDHIIQVAICSMYEVTIPYTYNSIHSRKNQDQVPTCICILLRTVVMLFLPFVLCFKSREPLFFDSPKETDIVRSFKTQRFSCLY